MFIASSFFSNLMPLIRDQKEQQFDHAAQHFPNYIPIFTNFNQLLYGLYKYLKRDILSIWFFGCLAGTLTLGMSLFSGYVFSQLYHLQSSNTTVLFLSFMLILIFMHSINYMNEVQIKNINLIWLSNCMPGVWHHVLTLPAATMKQYQSGNLAQLVFDYELAVMNLSSAVLTLIPSFLALICLFSYMYYCQINLAIIYLLISIVFMLVKIILMLPQAKAIIQMLQEQGAATQWINEMLLQIHKIRSSGAETIAYQKWLQHALRVKIFAERAFYPELHSLQLQACMPMILTICIILILSLTKSTDIITLLQFILCASQFSIILDKISVQINIIFQLKSSLKRMTALAAESKEYEEIDTVNNFDVAGDIIFENVSFYTPDKTTSILSNINIKIHNGKTTAIIGKTGAGKSSLIKLILGLEIPDAGRIKINDMTINTINIRSLRKQFGSVLQASQLMPGTIYDNIALNCTITHERAWELAQHVGMASDIQAMPMKMHTFISDQAGESLSGGQKQKILIARALASNPKILLLDEATSALDNPSQALIINYLQQLNITIVIVGHRNSTFQHADWIYVMEEGAAAVFKSPS